MNIKNYEVEAGAMKNEVRPIIGWIGLNLTKDAERGVLTRSSSDIVTTPWRPQPVQLSYLRRKLENRRLARFIGSG